MNPGGRRNLRSFVGGGQAVSTFPGRAWLPGEQGGEIKPRKQVSSETRGPPHSIGLEPDGKSGNPDIKSRNPDAKSGNPALRSGKPDVKSENSDTNTTSGFPDLASGSNPMLFDGTPFRQILFLKA